MSRRNFSHREDMQPPAPAPAPPLQQHQRQAMFRNSGRKRNSINMRRNSAVLNYEHSKLFGLYREDISNFVRLETAKRSQLDPNHKTSHQERGRSKVLTYFCAPAITWGGDMLLLTLLAIILSIFSFTIDIVVHLFFDVRTYLTTNLTDNYYLKFVIWVAYIVVLISISFVVTRLLAPQAAGSGVAEMKVVLRGVILKEYLSLKTLAAKVVGLTFALSSGLPLGKEGPFVHIASITANQLMKLFAFVTGRDEYESKYFEIIAVACGVGVAVTFAAPVGGLLYCIEIVSVYFSVRSYWQGFFAATIGALVWRLLTVWFNYEENITHIFHTKFRLENPYELLEIFTYTMLGVLCGLASVAFVWLHRNLVRLNRRHNWWNRVFTKYPYVYVLGVCLVVGLISYPGLLGKYYASYLSSEESMKELFSNYNWHSMSPDNDTEHVLKHWRTPNTSVFAHTFMFALMNQLMVVLCSTLPIPYGLIVPSFKIGAGLGRFYGESLSYFFPDGLNPSLNRTESPILAGTYALAGSAAFASANTGALSSAVISFEMTGQITHLIPVILATLGATIVARRLCPSVYDSIILLKKLPYLPPILPSSSAVHNVFVEDFMNTNLRCVWRKMTYGHLRTLLEQHRKVKTFPFVKSSENRILLGTVERVELQYLFDNFCKKQSELGGGTSQTECPMHGSTTRGTSLVGATITEGEVLDEPRQPLPDEDDRWLFLEERVDFGDCPIEPSPLQLAEGTPLLKVHSLFSLLGLPLAYVTSMGTLVGVVSLKELRQAIENMNNLASGHRSRQDLGETGSNQL